MAEMNLKAFYESTQPFPEAILNFSHVARKRITEKEVFVHLSNIGFAMLAHLKADSIENLEKCESIKYYFILVRSCKALHIITEQRTINPTAVPMIQKYMKVFEVYEQQNGIKNPFAE